MTRKISAECRDKLKQWEGLVLYAYDDADTSVPKTKIIHGMPVRGTLTIGYGSTSGVFPGQEITEDFADKRLILDLMPFERAVDQGVKVPLNDNQFGALVSFAFNVGIRAFQGSTLLKKLNAGDYESVPRELMKWVKTTINGKKVVSDGLVNRRAAEAGLWAKGAFVATNTVSAEPYNKPLVTKESVAWGVPALTGLVAAMEPVLDGTGPVQWAFAGAIAITFALGAYWFLRKRMQPG